MARKQADIYQKRMEELAPMVKNMERLASEFSDDPEQVLPEAGAMESGKAYREKKQNPSYFVNATKVISTKEQFRNHYSIPLRDFNTAGVVCAHLGRLLSSMKQGYYKVYDADVKVNSEKIQECLNAIDMIVDRL